MRLDHALFEISHSIASKEELRMFAANRFLKWAAALSLLLIVLVAGCQNDNNLSTGKEKQVTVKIDGMT